MSNISRRDFLKTAGVMTLAVAAAGVLAGCEGQTTEPETPVIKPDQGLTETTEIGKFSFSVQDAKLVEHLPVKTDKNEVDYTKAARVVALLIAVKNNGEGAAQFGFDKLKFYINGDKADAVVEANTKISPEQAKVYFGSDTPAYLPVAATNVVADKAKADLYYVTFNFASKDGDGKFKDITSVQVRYQEDDKAKIVNYDLGALTPTKAIWEIDPA